MITNGLLIRDVQPKSLKYTVGSIQNDGVEKLIISIINNNSNYNSKK